MYKFLTAKLLRHYMLFQENNKLNRSSGHRKIFLDHGRNTRYLAFCQPSHKTDSTSAALVINSFLSKLFWWGGGGARPGNSWCPPPPNYFALLRLWLAGKKPR